MERDNDEKGWRSYMIKLIPVFKDGSILRTEMLQKLSEFAFVLPNLMHVGFTDGVVEGCDITAQDGQILVSKGVVIFGGQLFLMDQEVAVDYHPTNKTTWLNLCYFGEEVVGNGIHHKFSIALSEEKTKEHEIGLCSFKLQEGAKLRFVYDDFEDLNTEYDTINLLHTQYASKKIPALNPNVLKLYANELLSFHPQSALDIAFCMQIIGSNSSIHMDAVITYIFLKTGVKIDKIANINIYRSLLSILKEERMKVSGTKTRNIIKKRTILVD